MHHKRSYSSQCNNNEILFFASLAKGRQRSGPEGYMGIRFPLFAMNRERERARVIRLCAEGESHYGGVFAIQRFPGKVQFVSTHTHVICAGNGATLSFFYCIAARKARRRVV